ncbi:MAG: aldo/keto reductase [Myxococcota bacterium]|nr:aldo/keto reductase [Myxococcota bacterium]
MRQEDDKRFTRRWFLKTSGAVAAATGSALVGCGAAQPSAVDPVAQVPQGTTDPGAVAESAAADMPAIKRHRRLGRTGFAVSDISMGCARVGEKNVVRYAYDRGVNLFDLAESYGKGDAERNIGEAMAHMDRKKIFLQTKVKIEKTDTAPVLVDRFNKCLERMKTDYVDALHFHSVVDKNLITHAGFHEAVTRLKQEGKVKYTGISCHGPWGEQQGSMEEVLLAAVEDGRFDVMLLVYNFMKSGEGERVLKACKEKNIGTQAMKTYTGKIEVERFDPENPSGDYKAILKMLEDAGLPREEAIARIYKVQDHKIKEAEKYKPAMDAFLSKHGVNTQKQLEVESVRWVFANPAMHTVCVSFSDFDRVDRFLPISGTELSARGAQLLRDYELAFSRCYCRHGCTMCMAVCPHRVPVSRIMRYFYYFDNQGSEKQAMEKYAKLGRNNASSCLTCDAPCSLTCPHGVAVHASLLKAHATLSLA